MSKLKDLTGQRFGRLTVLSLNGKTEKGNAIWKCLCDCGKEIDVVSYYLIRGSTQSCGCLQKESARERNVNKAAELTGKQFGRLTVIEKTNEKTATNRALWRCRCSCGNEILLTSGDLLSRNKQRCGTGCKQSQNIFNFLDDYIEMRSSKNEYLGLLDIDDYSLISGYSWILTPNGYLTAYSHLENGKSKRVTLSRLLMNPKDDEQVDHINGDTTDNRRKNLRVCTPSQNSMNIKTPSDNTSGKKGVYWRNDDKKWGAYIQIGKRTKNLGSCSDFQEACDVRDKAELKYYGEFVRQNENVEGKLLK